MTRNIDTPSVKEQINIQRKKQELEKREISMHKSKLYEIEKYLHSRGLKLKIDSVNKVWKEKDPRNEIFLVYKNTNFFRNHKLLDFQLKPDGCIEFYYNERFSTAFIEEVGTWIEKYLKSENITSDEEVKKADDIEKKLVMSEEDKTIVLIAFVNEYIKKCEKDTSKHTILESEEALKCVKVLQKGLSPNPKLSELDDIIVSLENFVLKYS